MKAKSPANWGVQITGMIFQTRSKEEENMENKKAFGHALAIFTIFIWGTTFISTKILLQAFQPVEILFFRFVMGFILLWIMNPHRLPFKSWK